MALSIRRIGMYVTGCHPRLLYLTRDIPLQTVIYSITGIPGAFLAGWLVDLPLLGRKGTLTISCCKFMCNFVYNFLRMKSGSRDGGFPVRYHNCKELQLASWLELWIHLLQQRMSFYLHFKRCN